MISVFSDKGLEWFRLEDLPCGLSCRVAPSIDPAGSVVKRNYFMVMCTDQSGAHSLVRYIYPLLNSSSLEHSYLLFFSDILKHEDKMKSNTVASDSYKAAHRECRLRK